MWCSIKRPTEVLSVLSVAVLSVLSVLSAVLSVLSATANLLSVLSKEVAGAVFRSIFHHATLIVVHLPGSEASLEFTCTNNLSHAWKIETLQ